MSTATTRRLVGASAIPALALGLAACTSGSSESGSESGDDAAAQPSPQQLVLASYEGLNEDSYKMESTMTVNDLEFMTMTNSVEGEAMRATQDMQMSVILEATGDDYSSDPEMAEMMEQMFSDTRTESILVDDVLYMQLSGGMFASITEEFGEDAWFTIDLAEDGRVSDVYEQFGSFDLASQTETLLTELSDVEETADGVYTGTLSADSEAMQSMLGATGGASSAVDGTEVTITVDDEGLLETMEMAFPETDGMTMNLVSEIVEVGGEYGIAAPDSDNIHSFDDFAGAMPE
ncbi:hypothetical protein [Glycomyces tarimensis]